MYSRQEASKLRQEFWTRFGQYMIPVVSAEGEKVNWINYKTGEKNISFRMYADNKKAGIAIELTHPDKEIRQIYFEQFLQLKSQFDNVLKEAWIWQSQVQGEHERMISRIYKEIDGVSIFQKQNWGELISFFKPRIIALDDFWSSVKYAFESLR